MTEDQNRNQSIMTLERIEANANLTLWCVHVLGPDDVIPTPSHEAAVEQAHEINLSTHKEDTGMNDILCFAYALPWPYDKETHRKELEDKP